MTEKSIHPEKSVRPEAQPDQQKKSATSGQHPAVKEYRRKLESIDERTANAQDELDRKLDEFLTELKSEPPASPTGPPAPASKT